MKAILLTLLTLLLAVAALAQNVTISASETLTVAEFRAWRAFVAENFAAEADANADGMVTDAEARAWGSSSMRNVIQTFKARAVAAAEAKITVVETTTDRRELSKAHADALADVETKRAALAAAEAQLKTARLARIE